MPEDYVEASVHPAGRATIGDPRGRWALTLLLLTNLTDMLTLLVDL